MALFGEKHDHVRAIKFGEHGALWRNSRRIQAKSGILKSFQKELLLQDSTYRSYTGDPVKGFFASQENALNEINCFENPQDVKAVSQEENVKLKQVEIKPLTNSRNKWSAVSSSAGGS
jgi:hypothetical protein